MAWLSACSMLLNLLGADPLLISPAAGSTAYAAWTVQLYSWRSAPLANCQNAPSVAAQSTTYTKALIEVLLWWANERGSREDCRRCWNFGRVCGVGSAGSIDHFEIVLKTLQRLASDHGEGFFVQSTG